MGKLIETYTTFETSIAIAAVAAGAPICQIVPKQTAPAVGQETLIGLTRLRVVLTSAVAGFFSLTSALTVGTANPGMEILGRPVSAGNGGFGPAADPARIVFDWTVAPTPTAGDNANYEQDVLPATIGAGFEWTWPDDDPLTAFVPFSAVADGYLTRLVASQGKGLLLMNTGVGASPAILVSVRWIQFKPEGP